MEMQYGSKGVANTGLGLGIAGTALGLLNGGAGNILGGMWGNGNNGGGYVTQDQAEKSAEIASLMAENALLKAGKDIDAKMVNVYSDLNEKTLNLERELTKFKAEQAVVNANIGSQLAVANTNINCIQTQLGSLTKVVIPNASVCPGWGTATVSVSTGTTTA